MKMVVNRYNEIVEKLSDFQKRLGWGIPHWWFMELSPFNGLINLGGGPREHDQDEKEIQEAITNFLKETGISVQEMFDWGHEAQYYLDIKVEKDMEDHQHEMMDLAMGHDEDDLS